MRSLALPVPFLPHVPFPHHRCQYMIERSMVYCSSLYLSFFSIGFGLLNEYSET